MLVNNFKYKHSFFFNLSQLAALTPCGSVFGLIRYSQLALLVSPYIGIAPPPISNDMVWPPTLCVEKWENCVETLR